MKTKAPSSGNPRGRGTYNPACDVCARKKTKCDGNKPICQPCRQQGREQECAWTKNPVRKPRTEQHFEAMHKRGESLRVRALEWRKYADYLESQLEQYTNRNGEFRASRPSDSDGLLGPSPDIFDHELDLASDDGNSDSGDPAKELCIPTQSLKLEENGFLHHYGNTAPFRFDHAEPPPSESSTQLSRFPALAQNPDAIYVLLTDGVPDNHYNPDFDWSRHLPEIVPLDRRTHDKALDLIFKFFTSWCLRVVPALFLRDMYRSLSVPASHPSPKTPHYSPMLHNALVALGLAFVDDSKLRDLKSRQYFANKAKSYIEIECSKPNLSVVNALSILASFHSSKGDQTLGYLYFGMSARMAQALGLNVDCSEWVKAGVMDESELLDRRWTYWTTFTQDVCWSLYVGREFGVPAPTTDTVAFKAISMPLVDEDYDQLPWTHPSSKLEPQPNYLTITFQATCELLMISRRIMDLVNRLDKSHSRPIAIDALITEIDLNLNTWKNGLSPELDITHKSRQTSTPHKLMMHLAYWWLFILLHRPFFQRTGRLISSSDREIDHVKLCRRAAENIMELLSTWRSLYTLRYCPITLIQTVFSAGTVYLLTGMQASTGIRVAQKELGHSIRQQELVLEYLGEIGRSWQCATNIAGIMKNLMNEQLKPLLERKTIPISTSPSGISLSAEFDNNDDDDDPNSSFSLSKDHIRRHSSLTRPKHHRISIHSRGHSVNDSPNPSPAAHHSNLSPSIIISHNYQDTSTYAVSSSPGRSAPIPIPIQAPLSGDSSFSSNSPSSLHPSFTDPWIRRRSNLLSSGSASPVIPSPSSLYVTSALPSSAPTSFSQHDIGIDVYGQTIAQAPPALDELAFSGSGHTASHLFQGNGASFDIPQDLGIGQLSQASSANQFTSQELSKILGMPGGGALSMAPSVPFIGLNFSAVPLSPESTFSFDSSPQTSFSTNGFPNYDSSAAFEAHASHDTDMDDGTIWDFWAQTLER